MHDDRDAVLQELRDEIALLRARVDSIEQMRAKRRSQTWRDKFRPKLWQYEQYPGRPLSVPAGYIGDVATGDALRIAIVTPTLNHSAFIHRTIDSVLDQAYPNLDYVVQDGGSRDATIEILRSYGDRLKWYSEPDAGQADAINRGFERVSGDIMAYLNSDDVLLPGTLAYVASIFANRPEIHFVYGHRIYIDKDGLEIGRAVLPKHDPETLKWADYVPQETMFWRRSVWEKLQSFDVSFHYAMDWDFLLRSQDAGFRLCRLPRFLACFRVHPQQKTTAMSAVGHVEQEKIRLRQLGFQPTQREIEHAIRRYLRRHVLFHRLYKLPWLKY